MISCNQALEADSSALTVDGPREILPIMSDQVLAVRKKPRRLNLTLTTRRPERLKTNLWWQPLGLAVSL